MASGLMEQVMMTKTPLENAEAIVHRRFVKYDGTDGITYAGAADTAIGIAHRIDNAADTEYDAETRNRIPVVRGIIEVESAETITVGAAVGSDAAGKAVVASAGEVVKGVAVTGCTGADSILVDTEINTYVMPAIATVSGLQAALDAKADA